MKTCKSFFRDDIITYKRKCMTMTHILKTHIRCFQWKITGSPVEWSGVDLHTQPVTTLRLRINRTAHAQLSQKCRSLPGVTLRPVSTRHSGRKRARNKWLRNNNRKPAAAFQTLDRVDSDPPRPQVGTTHVHGLVPLPPRRLRGERCRRGVRSGCTRIRLSLTGHDPQLWPHPVTRPQCTMFRWVPVVLPSLGHRCVCTQTHVSAVRKGEKKRKRKCGHSLSSSSPSPLSPSSWQSGLMQCSSL